MREPHANLKTRTYLTLFLIATSIAIGTTSSIATQAFAGKDSAQKGLDNADQNIHENTGSTPANPSPQDIRHHEGNCQGGHSSTVLDSIGGCGILTDPGNSDDHRQNPKNNP